MAQHNIIDIAKNHMPPLYLTLLNVCVNVKQFLITVVGNVGVCCSVATFCSQCRWERRNHAVILILYLLVTVKYVVLVFNF